MSADGTIKIAITVDDKQINIATDSLKDLESASRKSGDGLKETEQGAKHAGRETKKGSGNIKDFAVSLGLVKVASAAFNVLRKSLDSAISRFDTLNTFPKVLQALGVSAEESEKAMSNLSDGIDGLPTKLDEIASTAQRMYTSFNDMDKATESALALNNALLGSGASADQAKRGTDQYLKALQTGKMELDTFNSLSETMDVGLIKIAEGFGFAGRTAKTDLYDALKNGAITMDEFNDKLIEVGTGTGIMAELAKENSLGLATSIGNLKNAAARGLADIIDSFNKLSQEVTGKDIAQNIDGLKVIVNQVFKAIGNAIEKTTPFVKGFASAVEFSLPAIKALTPALIGLASAYAIHAVLGKTIAALQASKTITTAVTAAKKLYTLAVLEAGSGLVTTMAIEKAHAIALASKTAILKLSALAYGVMTGAISISTAVQIVATAASYALGAAIQFLLGPVGWVTAGIGLLIGIVGGLIKIFKRSTAEGERLRAETEELSESTDALIDSVNGSSDAYKQSQRDIQSTAKANQDLAKRIEDLANKENKSAAEKQMLSDHIEELNGRVDNLNLAYDEEANALSMSSDEMAQRIGLMEEEASYEESKRRMLEIDKEQRDIEAQLAENIAKRKEIEDNSNITKKEAKETTKELTEKEAELVETLDALTEQQKVAEEQMISSMEAMEEASRNGITNQIIDFENLEGAHKDAAESMMERYDELATSATDAFDKIETKTDHTMQSMTETLEHNQKVVSEWAENQAKLMEWAGENGYDNLVPYIESMGIDSAAELAVLANASEDEMIKFADALETGAETGGDAFKTSLGGEFDEAIDQMIEFVNQSSATMEKEMKNAGFDEIGKNIPEGVTSGLESGTPDVEKASKDMADKSVKATQQALSIHSPSRVFRDIGTDSTDGLTLGINNGTTKVIRASTKMAADMLKPHNRTTASFRSIGVNAMNGLNAGLNAGRNRVMATARNIANQVASTMRSALRIHSPSRVMRDDIGFEIPAGIAVGIKDNAKSIFNELDKLTSGIMRFGTPELALGTGRMAVASATNQSATNAITRPQVVVQTNSSGNNTPVNVNMHATLLLDDEEFPVVVRKITKEQEWQER